MEDFEVAGLRREPKTSDEVFFVAAINYRLPSYVTFLTRVRLEISDTVGIEGEYAYRAGKKIGVIRETKNSLETGISLDFIPTSSKCYSLDGRNCFLDGNFPRALFVNGIMVSTMASIGLHHELPEKWLTNDGFDETASHRVATRTERKYVESLGVDWEAYCSEVRYNLNRVYGNGRVPITGESAHYALCLKEAPTQARNPRSGKV